MDQVEMVETMQLAYNRDILHHVVKLEPRVLRELEVAQQKLNLIVCHFFLDAIIKLILPFEQELLHLVLKHTRRSLGEGSRLMDFVELLGKLLHGDRAYLTI